VSFPATMEVCILATADALHRRVLNTMGRFTVDFCGFEWVGNHDRTRWFLVLKASVVPNSEVVTPCTMALGMQADELINSFRGFWNSLTAHLQSLTSLDCMHRMVMG